MNKCPSSFRNSVCISLFWLSVKLLAFSLSLFRLWWVNLMWNTNRAEGKTMKLVVVISTKTMDGAWGEKRERWRESMYKWWYALVCTVFGIWSEKCECLFQTSCLVSSLHGHLVLYAIFSDICVVFLEWPASLHLQTTVDMSSAATNLNMTSPSHFL